MSASEREEARKLRDQGIERAGRHADRVQNEWRSLAYAALLTYLKDVAPEREGFTAEDVRVASGLPEPPDRRAWGGVFVRAAHAKLIRKIGYRPYHARSRHCGPSTVWERVR